MNILRRFMAGRYGMDQLSLALLILSVLITLIASLIRLPVLSYVGDIPLLLALFRALSRNIEKRRIENYKFSMFISPAYSWLLKKKKRISDSKTHKYFKCQNCKAELRVPKGKGNIVVTCPKCRTEFRRKT